MRERQDEIQLSRRRSRSANVSRPSAESRRADERQAEETTLPPRRVKFPSNKYQTARWFYNSLIVLFLALMTALFMLGRWMHGN